MSEIDCGSENLQTVENLTVDSELGQVKDADGNMFILGHNNGKVKIYDEDGNQITKSCHICQAQHVNWDCGKGCRASYCSRCLNYCGLTVQEAIKSGCARCKNTCICMKCLRDMKRTDVSHVVPAKRLERLRDGNIHDSSPSEASSHLDKTYKPRKVRNEYVSQGATQGAAKRRVQVKKKNSSFPSALDETYSSEVSKKNHAPIKTDSLDIDVPLKTASDVPNDAQVPKPPKADEACHFVKEDTENKQEYIVHPTGENLGKTRTFDETGMIQLSKSCHQCQDQHMPFVCTSGREGCKASYCLRCCEKYYKGISFEELMEKCPRCRGFCNCRGCLRTEWEPRKPTTSPEQTKVFADHVLECTGGYIKDVLQSYDNEVLHDNITLEDVVIEAPNSRRINCDRCSTSIPDLYRACEDCGIDMCVDCCAELRQLFQKVLCPMCSHSLQLKKQLSADMLEDLRKIAKDYGHCKVTAQGPSWSWTSPSDEIGAKCDNTEQLHEGHWSQIVDKDMVRMATNHPDDPRKYVFCPTQAYLKTEKGHLIFQECLRRGEPVIVRDVKGVMDWRPETMCRAVIEKGNKFYGVAAKTADVTVINCTDQWGEFPMSQKTFFRIYKEQEHTSMLKVKDWPPDEHFKDRLKRHNQDFMEMLPIQEYSNPFWGCLNMHRTLPSKCLPPDIGPKTYVALGRQAEHKGEGDSVTKLHVDMSDAINVLLDACTSEEEESEKHVRIGDELWDAPSYGNAGAVWDIIRREDVETVDEYLRFRQGKFVHNGYPVTRHGVKEPIMEQMFQLSSDDRVTLREHYGVHLWHFEQHLNEAIIIPSGAPHQVRNLRSCIKVAIDFVPPESCGELIHLGQKLRRHAMSDREGGLDKLQGIATMLYAARESYRIKTGAQEVFAVNDVSGKRRRPEVRRKHTHTDDLTEDGESDEDVAQSSANEEHLPKRQRVVNCHA